MPHTINGIGTHYYGAGNRSARVDVCESCGRSTTLSSYDTREWICFVFIPVIPLRRYRILNDCSSCRRHHRIAADEFKQKLAQATAPLRDAMKRAPREPQNHIALIRTLIGWEMRADAQRELDAAVALFPQNAEVVLLAAQMAYSRGELEAARPLYERAYGIDPTNASAVYGYGWILHKLNQHEQAIPILQRSISQEGNKLGALYLLGTSQMKLSRWNDALNSYQQLLGLEPAYAGDKNFLRLIRECKTRLGYQLTDAEKRAGRSWWPFGRKQKPAKLQGQPTLVRPGLRIAGLVIVAIMIISLVFVGWDRWQNIEVYFDNGLDQTVKLDLDGNHFDVGKSSTHKEEMDEGKHTVVVHSADGKEIERLTFDLQKMSPFDAVMHDRFFVYNVAGQSVYRRAVHGYAARQENASYSDELIAMQKFFEQRDVDYPFQAAPDTISVDANSSTAVKKISFNTAKDVDLKRFAMIRLREGKVDEAKKAIEKAVVNAPCDTPTRRVQVYLAGVAESPEVASATAHRWIGDCAQDDLEAHRAYQDVNTQNGRQEALRAEYQKMLSASPDSGKAHYLLGRVTADPNAAIAQYQEAIRLDPKLAWPRVALGHAYQSMERYGDAFREFSTAIDMGNRDSSVVIYYANAAISDGKPADAVAKIEEIRKSQPRDYSAMQARWLLALASSDWQAAADVQKTLASREAPETTWWRSTKVLRLKGDPSVDAKIGTALHSNELRPLALQARASRLLESGEFAECANFVEQNTKDIDPAAAVMLEAYAAGGLLLEGKTADANKVLAEAKQILDDPKKNNADRVTGAVVDGLRGAMPVASVMDVAREGDAMPHAWFVAAVRSAQAGDRRGAAQNLAKCTRAASDLEFPYLEAKAMASVVNR
ncbi:MAG TPA: tetratricopeptide repeat protein [Thermoanaerobaculia bacterium]